MIQLQELMLVFEYLYRRTEDGGRTDRRGSCNNCLDFDLTLSNNPLNGNGFHCQVLELNVHTLKTLRK